VATPEDILEHINSFYRRVHQTPGKSDDDTPVIHGRLSAQTIRQVPPAQVINLLLHQAIQDRASDIHILASEEELRIRFRIDGILHDVMSLPLELHPTLISRLKIVSGMNIAERRRPQDGQFSNDFQGRPVDVRVAISNTVTGEMAVLRLLDKNFTIRGLDQIGMRPDVLTPYRKLLKLPYGMVIVCGPTGAGKSTTLYASMLQTNRSEQNIISLEDPVEYRIKDIGQMQVHPEAGVTFALQLRSVLRLDPDVIQVGEIRDQETAVIATHAALTGHLVLTSLHANESVSALMRLRDLGVAPYLVISQRMARRICTSCQTSKTGDAAEQRAYLAEMGQPRNQFIVGAGCNMCAHTGYYGRTGVFELLVVTDTIRQMFLDDQPRDRILEEALKEGLVPMRRDGMMKVKEEVTTPYEVMRVLFSLESADPA
jgi:type II secretory ATPase GspE/PulE/Tfp pilus assembly ATPase PilB-like protein